MGGAVFALWIANFLISLLFPVLLASVGLSGAFFIFALIGIGGAIFVIRWVPETRHRSLEQIEHYLHDRLSDAPAPIATGSEEKRITTDIRFCMMAGEQPAFYLFNGKMRYCSHL